MSLILLSSATAGICISAIICDLPKIEGLMTVVPPTVYGEREKKILQTAIAEENT